jgi:hypothetical protein
MGEAGPKAYRSDASALMHQDGSGLAGVLEPVEKGASDR